MQHYFVCVAFVKIYSSVYYNYISNKLKAFELKKIS